MFLKVFSFFFVGGIVLIVGIGILIRFNDWIYVKYGDEWAYRMGVLTWLLLFSLMIAGALTR